MRRPNFSLFVTDFDETITVSDTISAIANIASGFHSSRYAMPTWTSLVEAYLEEIGRVPRLTFSATETVSPLKMALRISEQKRIAEVTSIQRVSESGYLAGVPRTALWNGGMSCETRKGALQCLERVRMLPSQPLRVLSANWSRDFVLGALQTLNIPQYDVVCGDLVFEESPDRRGDMTTGKIDPKILDGADKLRVMEHWKAHASEGLVCYVGDSFTDVPCLLSCDLPFLIQPGDSLLSKLSSLRVDVSRVNEVASFEALLDNVKGAKLHGGALIYIAEWSDIERVITEMSV
ncbi:hypothetical protein M427DRAFT_51851 [Gonapodya prolifera JEL478]|uniref:HAD-like protein n=1 Tax=Gonapodya prolifera (strain JEL478) TaxID=1344416 RepID=A0A139AW15_GONPJ|nr:hypothetical protein M427DRAFT_51851 [Gonapodya prolifera JEL478]|eukprot:KXS20894.1 hypothetical protein M427DRAFT_51851 [Gonapodya prolifera JEL478]